MKPPIKKAIVTLAIGKPYEDMFNKICRPSWTEYAERFNFDLLVIKDPLDITERAIKRSPAWQKLLILSQAWSSQYDQIVWIDTDVMINNKWAADITENVPLEMVGAVEQYSIPSREIYRIALERQYKDWDAKNISYLDNLNPEQFYNNRGICCDGISDVVQTGVFVCSPKHHRQIFENIYYNYEDTHGSEWNYEMPAMSYELLKNNLIFWISNRFNYCASDVLAAYYPHLLGIEQTIIRRIIRKLAKKLNFSQTLPKELLVAINNVYDLSVFTHFASCSRLMMPFHSYLQSE
jgi:hypothetical protein